MKKQTAVEYLVANLDIDLVDSDWYIQKAKEMEKQQIIDAHGSKLRKSKGTTNYEYWYTGEQYFNETY
jgi:hypothetical protein